MIRRGAPFAFAVVCVGVAAIGLGLGGASASQFAGQYTTGLETVPASMQTAATNAASAEGCVGNGQLTTVSNAAATTLTSWEQMEPQGATVSANAQYQTAGSPDAQMTPGQTATVQLSNLNPPVKYFPSADSAVYAVFVQGSCKSSMGETIVGGRVILNPDGLIVQVKTWTSSSAPTESTPFGPQFDKNG